MESWQYFGCNVFFTERVHVEFTEMIFYDNSFKALLQTTFSNNKKAFKKYIIKYRIFILIKS